MQSFITDAISLLFVFTNLKTGQLGMEDGMMSSSYKWPEDLEVRWLAVVVMISAVAALLIIIPSSS